MPAYDYDCAACGRRFEVIHGVHAERPTACPLCGGGPIRKAVSAPAVHFKGSGWAKKERRSSAAGKSGKDGGSSTDGEGKEAAVAVPAKAADGTADKPADKPADTKSSTSSTTND
jgi:putative FmdB family regulatory protein